MDRVEGSKERAGQRARRAHAASPEDARPALAPTMRRLLPRPPGRRREGRRGGGRPEEAEERRGGPGGRPAGATAPCPLRALLARRGSQGASSSNDVARKSAFGRRSYDVTSNRPATRGTPLASQNDSGTRPQICGHASSAHHHGRRRAQR